MRILLSVCCVILILTSCNPPDESPNRVARKISIKVATEVGHDFADGGIHVHKTDDFLTIRSSHLSSFKRTADPMHLLFENISIEYDIDGSLQRHEIDNGYPGAEIGYVTAAVVLMDVGKIRNLDSQRPVNPIEFRKTEHVESIDSAFPGCNIVIDSEDSPKNSLRQSLFETFKETSMFSDGESLLDTYEALLEYKPEDPKPDCPYKDDDDCSAEDKELRRCNGFYTCHCSEENMLYSTDSLRIHERMVPDWANGEMFGVICKFWSVS